MGVQGSKLFLEVRCCSARSFGAAAAASRSAAPAAAAAAGTAAAAAAAACAADTCLRAQVCADGAQLASFVTAWLPATVAARSGGGGGGGGGGGEMDVVVVGEALEKELNAAIAEGCARYL